MADMKNLEQEKESFRAMCLEVMPLAEQIGAVIRKYGVESMAHLMVREDGFTDFNTCSGWEMTRMSYNDPFRIRYSYSEEIYESMSKKEMTE